MKAIQVHRQELGTYQFRGCLVNPNQSSGELNVPWLLGENDQNSEKEEAFV